MGPLDNNQEIIAGSRFSQITLAEPQGGGSVPKRRITVAKDNDAPTAPLTWVEKIQIGRDTFDAVRESIGLRFYGLYGKAPRSVISLRTREQMQALLSLYFQNDPALVSVFLEELNSSPNMERGYVKMIQNLLNKLSLNSVNTEAPSSDNFITFLSEYMPDWHPVGDEFLNALEAEGCGLRNVQTNIGEIPLIGLGEAVATALIIGDDDFIGGSGSNLGYVVDVNRRVAEVMVIDAGESFTANRISPQTFRQIKFAKPRSEVLQFDNFTQYQKDEFLNVLFFFSNCKPGDTFIRDLVKGNGKINSHQTENDQTCILLPDEVAEDYISIIYSNIQTMLELYETELSEYIERERSHSVALAKTDPFKWSETSTRVSQFIGTFFKPEGLYKAACTVAAFSRGHLPRAIYETHELIEYAQDTKGLNQ